jgi:hypothetical protein
MVEGLVLLHLRGGMDGDVVAICGHRDVIMCRIADQPPVSCGDGTKDEDHAESCDPSIEHELEPRLDRPDENARFTPPINFFILHSTCNNNTQQQVPSTLGGSVSISRTGRRKQGVV